MMDISDQIPSFEQILRVMPVATVVLLVVGLGFYVGWRVRGEAIELLREWLDSLRSSRK